MDILPLVIFWRLPVMQGVNSHKVNLRIRISTHVSFYLYTSMFHFVLVCLTGNSSFHLQHLSHVYHFYKLFTRFRWYGKTFSVFSFHRANDCFHISLYRESCQESQQSDATPYYNYRDSSLKNTTLRFFLFNNNKV